MNTSDTSFRNDPQIKVRRLTAGDLPRVLRTVRQTQPPPWRGWEFIACVRSGEVIGYLAEVQGQLAGFVLCTPVRMTDSSSPSYFGALVQVFRRLMGRRVPGLVCVNMLEAFVGAVWSGSTTMQELLERLDRELHRRGSHIGVVVPEAHLAPQLYLRGAGYQATRVLHEYFGDEDGYLMEWTGSPSTPKGAPRRRTASNARAPLESAEGTWSGS
jgi:hypothetical protein